MATGGAAGAARGGGGLGGGRGGCWGVGSLPLGAAGVVGYGACGKRWKAAVGGLRKARVERSMVGLPAQCLSLGARTFVTCHVMLGDAMPADKLQRYGAANNTTRFAKPHPQPCRCHEVPLQRR